MSMLVGVRRALLTGYGGGTAPPAITYLLNAPFTADNQGFADAQVLNTEAEGITDGQLTVVETAGALAIVGNECVITGHGAGWGNCGFFSQAIARALGYTLLATVTPDAVNQSGPQLGWADSAAIGVNSWLTNFYFRNTGELGALVYDGAGNPDYIADLFTYALVAYDVALVLGGYDANGVPWHSGEVETDFLYGTAFYLKGGAFGDQTLMWRSKLNNDATVYAIMEVGQDDGLLDDMRVPDASLSSVLEPTCLSTFTAGNGTSLDAITPEKGGTWTELGTGDAEIQTNKATNLDAVAGHNEYCTVESNLADALVEAILVPTDVFIKLIGRFVDDDNHWTVSLSQGGNLVKVEERDTGVTNTRASAGIAIVAGVEYDTWMVMDDETIAGYADGVYCTYGLAAFQKTETKHGFLLDNLQGNAATCDNFAVYPRTSAAYDDLDDV